VKLVAFVEQMGIVLVTSEKIIEKRPLVNPRL
jgi:hypothetical protein